MSSKTFSRSIAGLSFPLLFLLATFAHPASAQSDQAATPDTKTDVSRLSVWPESLSYNVNLDTGALSETKHFHITNEGTMPLKVVVNSPSNPAYVIKSGGGTATIPGKVRGNKAEHPSNVEVEFIPNGPVKSANGTINLISDATSGKNFAIVRLSGKSRQRLQTRTATATATATKTATATRTATATMTPTVVATATATTTPTTTATTTPTAGASTTPTATATSTRTASATATQTATATPTATAKAAGVTPTGSNASGKFGTWSPTSVSLYSGTTNGNLVMVMLCVSGPVTTFTPPAGYSQLGSIEATSTGEYCGLFYHVWSTGDPIIVSFADDYVATGTERNYITATYSGENTTTPFDPNTPSYPGSLSGATLTLSGVSPSGSGDLLASFWAEVNMSGGSPTVTYTSPLTEMTSYQMPKSWNKNYVANGALSASGSTGKKAATFSMAPNSGIGFIIAIQPATGATPAPTATAATATPTVTAAATATPTSIATVIVTATPTAKVTVTATATGGTRTPTATATPKVTATPSPTASGTPSASGLDQYGGTTSVQCSKGPAAHFYTQKIGNRWWLCDPAGNGFFLKGVYDIVANNNSTQTSFIQGKYAGPLSNWEANWALEQVHRLQAWGFNTVADYSISEITPAATDPAWGTSDNTIPVKMPFSSQERISHAAFQNVDGCGISSPVKDIMNGVGSIYTGYRYNFGDYFDPNFSTCTANVIKNDTWGLQQAIKSKYNSYLLYITIDESDQTGMLDQGPDFPSIGNNGQVGGGPNPSAHASWITLVSAPTQTSNSSQGVSYSNTTVYTKLQLSNWLSTRYSGNISALNSAWNSNYSTFGASGAGWGIGSGILDENGSCPSAANGQSCWVGNVYTLAGETSVMQSDMSAFYVYYLDQYFSVLQSQFNAAAPGILLQMQIGGWGAPPRREVLTEAAKYLGLPIIGNVPSWPCTNCTNDQAEIDFTTQYLGDHPWINWVGFWAQPDSAESAYATTNPGPFSTQAQRGTSYQAMINVFANASDTATSTYHIVGFNWWGMYDMDSQKANWGLLTTHDNPYDGKSATISGNGGDQWGYPTGGEAGNYGDFIDLATSANTGVYSFMLP